MKEISERKRRQITGRRADYTFVQLPHYILQSKEFLQLDPYAKALFMYFAGLYKGNNNGDFSAPSNRHAEIGFRSPSTLHRAKQGLEQSGFSVTTRHGHERVCTLYGLTIWPIDECDGKLEWPAETKASHLWKTKNEMSSPHVYQKQSPRVPKVLRKAA